MAAVGPVQAATVWFFHLDEATLQVAQTEICFQPNSVSREHTQGETIQDSTANLLLGNLNTVMLHIKGSKLCSGQKLFH